MCGIIKTGCGTGSFLDCGEFFPVVYNIDVGGGNMENWLYVMLIQRGKTYNKMTKEVVIRHVDHIRSLDDSGKLVLCGPTKGYLGVAGMVILRAGSLEDAEAICKTEPLVVEGFATYKVFALQVANRENNYLL